MLAVAVDLLCGRYQASEYNDRNRAEWPPHPARLFSALVAVWADAEQPDPAERAALQWLENQAPPQLACDLDDTDLTRRRVVTAFVPGNDVTALRSSVDNRDAARVAATVALRKASCSTDRRAVQRATTAMRRQQAAYRQAVHNATTATGRESASVIGAVLEMLPENRNRQPRTFPTITPTDPAVWFVWPDAEPDDATRRALDQVLARVARLGHSSSLVSCRIADAPADRAVTLVPRPDGTTMLRVPAPGLLDRLEYDFTRHHGTEPRKLPAAMTAYGAPAAASAPEPSGTHGGDWIVLDLLIHDETGQRQLPVHVTRALELAGAVRAALVPREPAEAEGLLSGLFPDGQARPHVAVVPLPDVGHRWAEGLVRGVALMAPKGTAREQIDAAVRGWETTGLQVALEHRESPVRFQPPRLVTADEGWSQRSMPLRRATWCRPSRRWISVTPVALDRFVRGLHHPAHHTPADEQAAEIVARSCVHIGLPEPDEVVISPVGMTAAVPRITTGGPDRPGRRGVFPRFVSAGSGRPRQTVHAQVTFPEPVRGPVLLGAGRYLGYGLFLPADAQGLQP